MKKTGEPEKYDIKIEASELIDDVEFPAIKNFSINNVIYKEDGFQDINFFNNSENKNKSWKKISKLVNKVFRITLYISVAIMLTLLIYVAIIIVSNSISPKDNIHMPFIKFFNRKNTNIVRESIEKKFVEQWIGSMILLVLIIYIMNLIISFSSYMTQITSTFRVGEDEDAITVYVVDSNYTAGENANYYFKTNIEGLLIFDSQYKGTQYFAKNFLEILAAGVSTLFAAGLEILFIFRMFIIAFLTATAPLAIIINAFYKVSGRRGFLQKWFILYAFFVFIKMVIGILYYALIKANLDFIIKTPIYIIFVILIMIGLIIYAFYMLNKNLSNKKVPAKAR